MGSNTIAEEEHFLESGGFDAEESKIGEIETIWKRENKVLMSVIVNKDNPGRTLFVKTAWSLEARQSKGSLLEESIRIICSKQQKPFSQNLGI